MRKTIYTVKAENEDICFIMEEVTDGSRIISLEVKGFYFGEPDEESTKMFYGKTKAEF